mgnify:CR=1 FL=1
MSTYNFDTIIDRRGTDCLKWDSNGSTDIHPMWVADMDFAVAPQIQEAMEKRLSNPVYGYTFHGEGLIHSIVSWVGRRYGWEISGEWLAFSPGVVPALSMSILALTNPGDRVLIMTPVYRPFYNSIRENGRVIIDNPLAKDDSGRYSIDFDLLESQIDSRCKVLMMCNPHNPAGRVWTLEELQRLADIARRHDLMVISDEIHADFIYSGHKHISIASLSEDMMQRTITAYAPSKTFNLAGLCQSYVVIPNKRLRDAFMGIYDALDLGSNIFGMTALTAAYNEAEDWLDQLLVYLEKNRDYAVDYFRENIPEIKVYPPDGTYLLWLDCSSLGLEKEELNRFFLDQARVRMNAGWRFADRCGSFMRLNIGCPRSMLTEGLERIRTAVSQRKY